MQGGDLQSLLLFFGKTWDTELSCLSDRCLWVVDRTASRQAGTVPQQLRDQDLGAAGPQHEEESLMTLSEDGGGACSQGEKHCEPHTSSAAEFSECIPRLRHQTKKSVRLTKRGSASKTVQPRGLIFSTVPSSTEQNYLLYL